MINITRLRDVREDNDINQEKMSEILGINRSAYSLWELGINVIPLKPLCDYADYFGFTIDYILGLTNDKKNKSIIKELNLKTLGNNVKLIRNKNNLSQEILPIC